jgi:hypothetical protein
VAVLQAEVGEYTLGSALGGAVEQVVEVLAAQEQHVLDEGGGLGRFSHGRSPKTTNPPRGRVRG